MGIEKGKEEVYCQTHGHYTAEVLTMNGKRIVEPCHKCLEGQETAEGGRLEPRKAGKVKGLPRRFWAAGFGDYETDSEKQERAKRYAEAYATKESVMERGIKMLFCGKPGTGKTHLAAAIVRTMAQRGVDCQFAHVYQVMGEVKATYDGPGSEKQVKQKYIKADFLAIDEIGVQKGSDFERNILFEIVNERHNGLKPTLLISNLGIQPLTEYLGEPFIDRFWEDGGQVLSFDWGSYRKKAKKN